jgi:phosphotransacetylase
MIQRLEQLVDLAWERDPTRVAVAAAAHKLVLQSVQRAVDLGLIVPLLVGRREEIRDQSRAIGWKLAEELIVPTETNRAAATAAVELVRQGDADVLTSRSDPPRARVYSLALASLLCQALENPIP